MRNIFRLLSILILFFAFTISAKAQVQHNEKEKKEIKKHHLTKRDKEVRKTFKRSIKEKKESIKNSALTKEQKKAQLAQLKKEKHDKLQAILTPDQKERMKQIKENTPRRGVTNMPNERTAK